jgi:hypothetical protein
MNRWCWISRWIPAKTSGSRKKQTTDAPAVAPTIAIFARYA